jgi:hypothetical protein
MPAMAPSPEATPKPSANGSAINATVIPDKMSGTILVCMRRIRGKGLKSANSVRILFQLTDINLPLEQARKRIPGSDMVI